MSSGSEDTDEPASWIQRFCWKKGNEFFCEVDKSYIEDGFNLYGLRNMVTNYQEALNIILDNLDSEQDESETMTDSAMQLYGLIHARYIVTTHGLNAMHTKFQQSEFGKCPRVLCCNQSVVPMGQHVDPEHDTVKIFCPKCGEAYAAPLSTQVDGAFFGPTFPHLFFMTFDNEMPSESPPRYVPRVYGFRIHATSSAAGPGAQAAAQNQALASQLLAASQAGAGPLANPHTLAQAAASQSWGSHAHGLFASGRAGHLAGGGRPNYGLPSSHRLTPAQPPVWTPPPVLAGSSGAVGSGNSGGSGGGGLSGGGVPDGGMGLQTSTKSAVVVPDRESSAHLARDPPGPSGGGAGSGAAARDDMQSDQADQGHAKRMRSAEKR
mmetsp:Transcript_30652/g.68736  ORF Transcript_30652/g.68736 Transcript_30652/m.68736 type:complete len:379 (+) Transcript_30652:171-1307(+)